jgi:hypothetical protein
MPLGEEPVQVAGGNKRGIEKWYYIKSANHYIGIM